MDVMTVIVIFLSLLLYSIFKLIKKKNKKKTNKQTKQSKKKIEIKHDKMISLTFFYFCFLLPVFVLCLVCPMLTVSL